MNLLGPELVCDLVSLIQRAEADDTIQVLVFKSAVRVGHKEVRDCDASPILPVLHGSQAPDEARAHARFLAHLAQRGGCARFPVFDVPLGEDPPTA